MFAANAKKEKAVTRPITQHALIPTTTNAKSPLK
jgi:hypothetical protein